MEHLSWAGRLISSFDLGGLVSKEAAQEMFDTTDKQKAWFIIWLMDDAQSIGSLFRIFVTEKEDSSFLNVYGNEVTKVAERMLAANTITGQQLREIKSTLDLLIRTVRSSPR